MKKVATTVGERGMRLAIVIEEEIERMREGEAGTMVIRRDERR